MKAKCLTSPCPSVCVGGCGCPEGMMIDEEQRRCVIPSLCPDMIKVSNNINIQSLVTTRGLTLTRIPYDSLGILES